MQFKIKRLNFSGGKHYIVIMNELTAGQEGIHVSSRVKLKNHKKNIVAVVDMASPEVLERYELGLFDEVANILKVNDGDSIEVIPISQPKSVEYIKKKLDGIELSPNEINEIIKDIVHNHLSEVEMSAFVTACYTNELTMNETLALTNSVVNTGNKLNFGNGIILDKHCVGGISGNRTSMLLVPIMASLGLKMPKTSSRSITSPAGTADTMEVLAPVELTIKKIKQVIKKAGACLVWGGAMNLAAADDKLISVRHPLALDPLGLMLSSIMAKKKAVGSTHVLIDIPLGEGAKTKSIGEAQYLVRQFEELGERLGMKLKVLITNGNHPIGKGIGPVLEARDILWVLENNPKAPTDLIEKTIYLAGEMLELSGKADKGQGAVIARETIINGSALKKFKEIIKLQGGKWTSPENLKLAKYNAVIKAERTGFIKQLDDDNISKIARLAGAPLDKGAGVYIHKQIDEPVRKGESVITIYAESQRLLNEALKNTSKQIFTIKKQ